MTKTTSAKRTCLRHGRSVKNGHRIPHDIFIAALILGAAAPGVLQAAPVFGRLSEGVIAYIGSPEADKSCGVCLTSADSFLESKKLAALRKKTKGMAYLPAGEYKIGSPDSLGDPDEHPRHQTYLDAFYIEKYEVTTADYMAFAKYTGDNYPEWAKPEGNFNIDTGRDAYYKHLSAIIKTCKTCPVIGVTAKNAEAYCQSKNRRLPTEAEWEAAARGGSDSAFSFGDNPAMAGDYAWDESNSGETPHPVGRKKPNKYGLYDMHGNVWEWVSDFYDRDYYSKSPKRNPKGPAEGKEHAIRGGSWAFDEDALRSGNRANTNKANDDIGFRCAVSESSLSDDAAATSSAVDIIRN